MGDRQAYTDGGSCRQGVDGGRWLLIGEMMEIGLDIKYGWGKKGRMR